MGGVKEIGQGMQFLIVLKVERYLTTLREIDQQKSVSKKRTWADVHDQRPILKKALQVFNGCYWLTSHDILDLLHEYMLCPEGIKVLSANELIENIATASVDCVHTAIVNTSTSDSGGVHWVCGRWLKTSTNMSIVIRDPKKDPHHCDLLGQYLTNAAEQDQKLDWSVDITGTGWQSVTDGWRCGYYSLYAALRVWQTDTLDEALVKMPKNFVDLVKAILRYERIFSGQPNDRLKVTQLEVEESSRTTVHRITVAVKGLLSN